MVFQDLGELSKGLLVVALLLAIGFIIISQVRVQVGTTEGLANVTGTGCLKSVACNATGDVAEAMDDVPGWLGLIVIVVVGALILRLLKVF